MLIKYTFKTNIKGNEELKKVLDDLEKLSKLPFLRDSHKERSIDISLAMPEELRKDQKYKVFDGESLVARSETDPIYISRTFGIVNDQLVQTEYHEWNPSICHIQNKKEYNPPIKLD